ncbi:MAG: peroxiredoxin-like family protein [Acidobacteriaceae bacterium]
MPHSTDLQTKLDNITTQTRALVQPDRLAITDAAVHDLFLTGIEDRTLPIGATAPTFDLPNAAATTLTNTATANTRLIHSSDLLAIGPLIVVFFRGRWCPYCMTQLEAWQAAFPAVREKGALLVAISPQLPRQNDFAAQHHNLTYPLLTDAGSRLADQFHVAYTVPEPMQQHYRSIMINIPFINGDQGPLTWRLPIPATFVIASNGKITFAEAHADHRVRPDPKDVLATL